MANISSVIVKFPNYLSNNLNPSTELSTNFINSGNEMSYMSVILRG